MAVERNPVRRSTDQDRYDADPHVLDDNFEELVLKDEGVFPPIPLRSHPSSGLCGLIHSPRS